MASRGVAYSRFMVSTSLRRGDKEGQGTTGAAMNTNHLSQVQTEQVQAWVHLGGTGGPPCFFVPSPLGGVTVCHSHPARLAPFMYFLKP